MECVKIERGLTAEEVVSEEKFGREAHTYDFSVYDRGV
jgi:hypothetical protein